jgi:hypothetical protein
MMARYTVPNPPLPMARRIWYRRPVDVALFVVVLTT